MGRREALVGSSVLAALGLSGATRAPRTAHVDLYSDTVALTGDGTRVLVPAHTTPLEPGTRLMPPVLEDSPVARAEQRLLEDVERAAAERDLPAERHDLLVSAALDIRALTHGLAAPVAGWTRNWRFVWPRDTAHAAVAELALGRVDQAEATVRELARLCRPDGWFEARYRPGTTEPPDDRERQLDGCGWYLWALDAVGAAAPTLLEDPTVQDAAERCARLLLSLTDGSPALPPPSPDYWEVKERRLTVATAALVLVGLERAGRLPSALGEDLAGRCAERAGLVRRAVDTAFGPSGYGRYAGRAPSDSGMMFLLPPYTLEVHDAVAARLTTAEERMRRPAGGIAPGESWKRDGISWTPETAMLAQAYRMIGADAEAERVLDWLDAHRTASGSFPEKVLADGSPAAVTPLAWTAALVVSTLLA